MAIRRERALNVQQDSPWLLQHRGSLYRTSSPEKGTCSFYNDQPTMTTLWHASKNSYRGCCSVSWNLQLVSGASADAGVTADTGYRVSEPEIKFSVGPPAVRAVALRHVRTIDFPGTFSPSCVCMSEWRGRTNGGLSPDLLTLSLFVMLRVYCRVLTRMWLRLTLGFS